MEYLRNFLGNEDRFIGFIAAVALISIGAGIMADSVPLMLIVAGVFSIAAMIVTAKPPEEK